MSAKGVETVQILMPLIYYIWAHCQTTVEVVEGISHLESSVKQVLLLLLL